jgi:hypothetical protein
VTVKVRGFPGFARRRRQAETPNVKQIYCSGGSGNIVAGKHNDGSRENRRLLADRLHVAMTSAWDNTQRHVIDRFDFRVACSDLSRGGIAAFG